MCDSECITRLYTSYPSGKKFLQSSSQKEEGERQTERSTDNAGIYVYENLYSVLTYVHFTGWEQSSIIYSLLSPSFSRLLLLHTHTLNEVKKSLNSIAIMEAIIQNLCHHIPVMIIIN